MDYKAVERDVFNHRRNLGASLVASAAKADGASVTWIDRSCGIIKTGEGSHSFHAFIRSESTLGTAFASNKSLTAAMLRDAGIPVPPHKVVRKREQLVATIAEIGFPVAVKPLDGNKGRGVILDIRNADDLDKAFINANEYGPRVIVEKYINVKTELRCMATPHTCLSAVIRHLPRVKGDGKSTILELILRKNALRSRNPSLVKRQLPIDRTLEQYLWKQDFALTDVLPKGQWLTVRNVGGLSGGGDAEEVIDSLDPEIVEVATDAVKALPGVYWAGVDIAIERGTNKIFVLEVNTGAGYGGSEYPTIGKSKRISSTVWRNTRSTWEEQDRESRERLSQAFSEFQPGLLPSSVRDTLAQLELPKTEARFSDIFRRYLELRGFPVKRISPAIMRASLTDGSEIFLTTRARGRLDPYVSQRILRSHTRVRKFLKLAGLEVPKIRQIRSVEQFGRLGQSSSASFRILSSENWSRELTDVYSAQGIIEHFPKLRNRSVQSELAGFRTRVICSTQGIMAVLALNCPALHEEVDLSAIRQHAQRALLAVPSLQWGYVDCVTLPRRNGEDPRILIEGLGADPVISQHADILYGSLESALYAVSCLNSLIE